MDNSNLANSASSQMEDLQAIKSEMTATATNVIAGTVIASKDFPNKSSLPRFIPLPFNNFGQFYLFDHSRYLQIIYQTATELQWYITSRHKNEPWWWAGGAFVVLSGLSILIGFPPLIPFPFIGAWIAYIVSESDIKKKLNEDVADFKSETISKLLNNEWEENKEVELPTRLKKSIQSNGKGEISDRLSPVLVMFDDEQPFPGFGKLQANNNFICRPKNIELAKSKEEGDLFDALIVKLRGSLSVCGIRNIGFGKVIVLNSDTISVNSPWLDNNKIPILSKEIDDVENVYGIDKSASVRVYFVVEVLFPKYDSAACFFIRSFKAGNSAGCHIALTTMGPPENGEKHLEKRLMKYKIEKEKADQDSIFNTEPKTNTSNTAEKELLSIRLQGSIREKFHEPIALSILDQIDPIEEKEFDEIRFDSKAREIVNLETSWPGKYYFFKYNVRERKSLTFGGDFFGKPELLGSIRTVYDQISRLTLESIEEQGFDISNYRDKEGKFSINAESIDKLIIGEVINMKSADEKKKDNEDK